MALNTKLDKYAPVALRFTLAIVFLYFGISQLISPMGFVGYLPSEVALLPISSRAFVILNGGFEVFAAIMLILGLFTRTFAFLLGAHLLGIAFSVGISSQIGVRDFGLSFATLTICLFSKQPWTLSAFFKSKLAE